MEKFQSFSEVQILHETVLPATLLPSFFGQTKCKQTLCDGTRKYPGSLPEEGKRKDENRLEVYYFLKEPSFGIVVEVSIFPVHLSVSKILIDL